MAEVTDDGWLRVKGRLRAEVGDAIYSSWFASMQLENLEAETAHISVPTRFLKSWIQAHYGERLLICWQSERPAMRLIDLLVRSAARALPPCAVISPPAAAPPEKCENNHFRGEIKFVVVPGSAAYDPHGGSPLDPRG
jgi:chromosomal replication initiator protein